MPLRNSLYGLGYVNLRAAALGASGIVDTAALDRYLFIRNSYLQRRRYLIYDGNPPREKDEGADAGQPAARGVNLRKPLELETSVIISGQPTPAEEELLLKAQTAAGNEVSRPYFRVWVSTPQP